MPKTRTIAGFLPQKACSEANIRTYADFLVFLLLERNFAIRREKGEKRQHKTSVINSLKKRRKEQRKQPK